MSATLESTAGVWVPKPGHGDQAVTAMQVPLGSAGEAMAAWDALLAWLTETGIEAERIDPDATGNYSLQLGDDRAWPSDWIAVVDGDAVRVKDGVFTATFEPQSAPPVAGEDTHARRDGPVVGGRWTLYDAELPFTAIGGACMVSGRSPKPGRRFFSIGVEVTDTTPNGDVCLDAEYVMEMAAGAGMVSADDHAHIHAQLTAANQALADAHARIAELEATSPAQLDTAAAIAELQGAVAEILDRLPKRKPAPAAKQQQTRPTGTHPQE